MAYILDDSLPEFLSCPFCGKEPVLQVDDRWPKYLDHSVKGYSVICNTIGCPIYKADTTYFLTKEEAIKKWNERYI